MPPLTEQDREWIMAEIDVAVMKQAELFQEQMQEKIKLAIGRHVILCDTSRLVREYRAWIRGAVFVLGIVCSILGVVAGVVLTNVFG